MIQSESICIHQWCPNQFFVNHRSITAVKVSIVELSPFKTMSTPVVTAFLVRWPKTIQMTVLEVTSVPGHHTWGAINRRSKRPQWIMTRPRQGHLLRTLVEAKRPRPRPRMEAVLCQIQTCSCIAGVQFVLMNYLGFSSLCPFSSLMSSIGSITLNGSRWCDLE